jgi:mono/diheme cytochrome c family protein
MTGVARTGLTIGATLLVLAIGALVFVGSGVYNIGADDHHTRMVLAIIEQLRERSIAVRARTIEVPDLADPNDIAAGAGHYATLCAGCHLAPGVTKSEVRPGLYPHPPNLAQQDIHDVRRAFWTIKHGIKMSAMPAWGRSLDDAAIWDIVAFLQRMQGMTPEAYQQLARVHSM